MGEDEPIRKNSSIRAAVSIQYLHVTDTHSDRQGS